MNQITRCK